MFITGHSRALVSKKKKVIQINIHGRYKKKLDNPWSVAFSFPRCNFVAVLNVVVVISSTLVSVSVLLANISQLVRTTELLSPF